MHGPTRQDPRTDASEALVAALVEQMERTFETDGRAGALAAMADLLRRLDPATLEALAVQREVDAEEPDREA